MRRQIGQFSLPEEGTLEGDVRAAHSGHRVTECRREYNSLKEEERLEDLKKEIEAQFPGAELTRVQLYNVDDPDQPLIWNYHIRIEGYAQRTGKRLFLQPAVLQHGSKARFSSATRKFPVYFHYPWMDVDHVTIKIPDGFELDNAEMPASLPLDQVGYYKVSARYQSTKRELIFDREFLFGKNLGLVFPVANYPAAKSIFEMIQTADQHVITLKQAAVKP